MSNPNMKSYWKGYRYAKSVDYSCGLSGVQYLWDYGLQGKSDMFCNGFKKYLSNRKQKQYKQ